MELTHFDWLCELLDNVQSEETIIDILGTAVRKEFITPEQCEEASHLNGVWVSQEAA